MLVKVPVPRWPPPLPVLGQASDPVELLKSRMRKMSLSTSCLCKQILFLKEFFPPRFLHIINSLGVSKRFYAYKFSSGQHVLSKMESEML